MAFFVDSKDAKIKVIVSKDRSLVSEKSDEYDPDKAYQDYLKDLDESKLRFVANSAPTRFVMKKVLPYKLAMKVKNHQVAVEAGKVKFQSSYMNEEVRCSLCEIEQPEVPDHLKDRLIPWKEDGAGGAAESVMEFLEAAGVVSDLYTAKQNAIGNIDNDALLKKKSEQSLKSVSPTQ